MTSNAWWGLVVFIVIVYPIWSPRMRRKRRALREAVSRNEETEYSIPIVRGGKDWAENSLWPEVFEEDDW